MFHKKEHITNKMDGKNQDPLTFSNPVPITFEIFKKEEVNIKKEDEDLLIEETKLQQNFSEHEYEDTESTECNDDNQEDLDNQSIVLSYFENATASNNEENAQEKVSVLEKQEFTLSFPHNNDENYENQFNEQMHFEINNRIYTCEECDMIFNEYCHLKNHITTTHKRVSDIICKKLNFSHTDETLNVKENMKQTFACAHCDKRFSSINDIKNHNKTKHLGNSYYKCVTCKKTFFIIAQLSRHSCSVHKYECQTCNKQFSHTRFLKRHSIVHKEKTHNSAHMGKKYTCDICHNSFSEFTALKIHINRVHFEGPPVCNEEFNFNEHYVSEYSEKRYLCHDCGKRFFDFSEIKEHISESHSMECTYKKLSVQKEDKLYACSRCDKRFSFVGHLTRHIRLNHSGIHSYYKCIYCNKVLKHSGNFIRHYITVHGNKSLNLHKQKNKIKPKLQSVTHDKKKFKCGDCYEKFYEFAELKEHIFGVHSEKESQKGEVNFLQNDKAYTCSNFNEKYSQMFDLKHHIKRVHMGISLYKCAKCNYKSSKLHYMKSHINTVHAYKKLNVYKDDKLYACSICDDRYYFVQDLTRHIRQKHSGIAHFKCIHCNVIIKRSWHFKRHYKNVHNIVILNFQKHFKIEVNNPKLQYDTRSKKKYECSDCKEKFLNISQIKKHIFEAHCKNESKQSERNSQQNDKLYACSNCNEQYSQISDLQHHMKEAAHFGNDDHKCSHCGHTFSTAYYLKSHINRVHAYKNLSVSEEDKLYACSRCDKRYFFVWDLTHHIRQKHSGIGHFKCIHCNAIIKRSCHFRRHYKNLHKIEISDFQKHFRIEVNPKLQCVTRNKKKFKCSDCNERFFDFSQIKEHIFKAHSRNESKKNELNSHQNVTLYACSNCNKEYSQMYDLKVHIKTVHFGFGSYQCKLCGKKFSYPRLRKHMFVIHNYDVRNYNSELCNKKKSGLHEFKKHNNLDRLKNFTKFECEHCKMIFSSLPLLEVHIGAHN